MKEVGSNILGTFSNPTTVESIALILTTIALLGVIILVSTGIRDLCKKNKNKNKDSE